MDWLGSAYENGRGVGRDYAEAVRWYREAADGQNADAAYKLGLIYESGRGVDLDLGEARRWYEKAAKGGNN
jgi:TPR repeat protein